jgi:hypothetical protein
MQWLNASVVSKISSRRFTSIFLMPPNADALQLRAHSTYIRDIVAARQLQALVLRGVNETEYLPDGFSAIYLGTQKQII